MKTTSTERGPDPSHEGTLAFEELKEGQVVAGAGRGESGPVARERGKLMSDLQGLLGEIMDFSLMIRT